MVKGVNNMEITLPEVAGINLVDLIKEKKKELESLETQLSMFKLKALETIKGMGLESIRKDGWQFTVVKMKKNIFHDDRAWDIVEQSDKNLIDFQTIDKDKFQMVFGKDNGAFEEIEGAEYLKITEVKK